MKRILIFIWLLCAPAAYAQEGRVYLDFGQGFNAGFITSSEISWSGFVRYRLNRLEIHGGGWRSNDRDLSNAIAGASVVLGNLDQGLNWTLGIALAEPTENISSRLRFRLAVHYDWEHWGLGFVHYSNGSYVFNHDGAPNRGVNLLFFSRKLY